MGFSRSPKVLKGALVQFDPHLVAPRKVLFQYNPSSIVRICGTDSGSEVRQLSVRTSRSLKLPSEKILMTVHFDATDAMEFPEANTLEAGLLPILSTLELIYETRRVGMITRFVEALFGRGDKHPLTLLFWGLYKVIPVRIQGMRIIEEAFDQNLNPIRVTVDLDLEVATLREFRRGSMGYRLRKSYEYSRETLASALTPGELPEQLESFLVKSS